LNYDCPKLLKIKTDRFFITKLGTIEKGDSLHYLIERQRNLFPERTLNPKTVRQSVITNWFRQGLGIKEVQIIAGHKYPSTTEVYRPTDLGQLKNAIGRFHPVPIAS
jgi:integrase/recombinase XerD